MATHVRIGELKNSIKTNNQLLTGVGEIQQHHLDVSVAQRCSICHQGENLCGLRSAITPLTLDEALKTDSTITEYEGGEETVAGATGRCQPADQAIMMESQQDLRWWKGGMLLPTYIGKRAYNGLEMLNLWAQGGALRASSLLCEGWSGLHGEQWLAQKKNGQDMIGAP
eukprot:1941581-Ditylum_brightwellii.AAC.1